MAKAYDRDLRLRVVAAMEAGATTEATTERDGVLFASGVVLPGFGREPIPF